MQAFLFTINIVSKVIIDLQLIGQAVGLEVIKILIENMDLKTPISIFFSLILSCLYFIIAMKKSLVF